MKTSSLKFEWNIKLGNAMNKPREVNDAAKVTLIKNSWHIHYKKLKKLCKITEDKKILFLFGKQLRIFVFLKYVVHLSGIIYVLFSLLYDSFIKLQHKSGEKIFCKQNIKIKLSSQII